MNEEGGPQQPDEEGGPQHPSDSTHPPDEELRQQMEEQIKQLRIDDVLLQTVVTLVNLTGRKLTVEDEQDIEQAGKGIEAVRALLPLCPEEQVGPIREALSQLQMLFARESQEPGQAPQPSHSTHPPDEDQEREKARSKLWTPPGTEQQ